MSEAEISRLIFEWHNTPRHAYLEALRPRTQPADDRGRFAVPISSMWRNVRGAPVLLENTKLLLKGRSSTSNAVRGTDAPDDAAVEYADHDLRRRPVPK